MRHGLRASLFHLGILWRVNELLFLPESNRSSSVLADSIPRGYLIAR